MMPGDGMRLRGRIALPVGVVVQAALVAAEDFARCEAEAFSGEEVRDIELPAWIGDGRELLPQLRLAEAGLSLRACRDPHLYATCGVDPHVDEMDGLSVALVLHSDGFTFRQGSMQLQLQAGDWFVFDDRYMHEVCEGTESTSLLVLTAAVEVTTTAAGRCRAKVGKTHVI